MIRKSVSNTKYLIFVTLAIASFIGLYAILCYHQKSINSKDTSVPNIRQFIQGFETLTKPDVYGEMWLVNDLGATYKRHLLGMTVGILLSLIVGIAMGCVGEAEAALKFPITCLAKVPPTAMIALYFVVFGTGIEFYVAIIALGIFPTLVQSIYQSVKNDISDDAIYKAYTLGASYMEIIVNIIFPQILPRFIEAIRITVGPALIFLIAAEWMMSDVGIGYRLKIQSRLQEMNVVYMYLLVLCFTSYVMDYSLTYTKRKLCPWFKE